jgi:hypothetical protein
LYELRNFAQHYDLPLNVVRVTGEATGDAPMTMIVGGFLERDKLLTSGYDWRDRAQDLTTQAPEFDVVPLCHEYLNCLRTLVVELARAYTVELAECREYLSAVRRMLKAPPDARLYMFDESSGMPPTSGIIIPEEQFAWILSRLASATGVA